jgi:hypothetical protein
MHRTARHIATGLALTAALAAPAAASASHGGKLHRLRALAAAAGTSRTAVKPPAVLRRAQVSKPGHRSHARRYKSFYAGVGTYCYGRTASQGGGGYMVVSVAQHAGFGFPYGTRISWKPWVYWSNTGGAGWWTNQGWRSYTVMADGNTSSGQGVWTDANGNTYVTIGGTSVPGTATYADPLGIAPRTWARAALELQVNGRSYMAYLTPDHGDSTSVSGDYCYFN